MGKAAQEVRTRRMGVEMQIRCKGIQITGSLQEGFVCALFLGVDKSHCGLCGDTGWVAYIWIRSHLRFFPYTGDRALLRGAAIRMA